MNDTGKTIRIACPHCGAVLETEANVVGIRANCPECGREFVVYKDKGYMVKAGKPRSKTKRIIGIGLLVGALLFVIAKSSTKRGKPATDKEAFKAHVVSIVDTSFSQLPVSFDRTWDGDTLVVKFWCNDMAAFAMFAASELCENAWDTFKHSCITFCNTITSKDKDIHVRMDFFDANNFRVPLLSIHDGIVVCDATLL